MSYVISIPLALNPLYILSHIHENQFEIYVLHSQKAYSSKLNITDVNVSSRVKYFLQNGYNDNYQKLSVDFTEEDLTIEETLESTKEILVKFCLNEEDFVTTNEKFLNLAVTQQETLINQFETEKALLLHQTFVLLNAKKNRIAQLYDIIDDNLSLHHCKCQTSTEPFGVGLKKRRLEENQNVNLTDDSKSDIVQMDHSGLGTSKNNPESSNSKSNLNKNIVNQKETDVVSPEPEEDKDKPSTSKNNDVDLKFDLNQYLEEF